MDTCSSDYFCFCSSGAGRSEGSKFMTEISIGAISAGFAMVAGCYWLKTGYRVELLASVPMTGAADCYMKGFGWDGTGAIICSILI